MEVKGSAVISMRDYVAHSFSSRYQEWSNSLSIESQRIVSGVLSSSWYPLQPAIVEPTRKICDLFHNGNDKGAWQLGRFSAEDALKGIYAMFFKLGSPGFIVSQGSRILSRYYHPCETKVTENTARRAVVQIVQFDEPNHLVEMRIAGWMERAIELNGKNASASINRSMAKGDTITEFCVEWE
jgi:hypothetical protein